MQKVLWAGLLGIVSTCACADWIEIESNDVATVYANPASIRKVGSVVKMWVLYDLRKPDSLQGKNYWSMKSNDNHDCSADRTQRLHTLFYAGNMGSGNVIPTQHTGNNPWKPVIQDTLSDAARKFACKEQQREFMQEPVIPERPKDDDFSSPL